MSRGEGVKRAREDAPPRVPRRRTAATSASREGQQELTALTSVLVVCRLNPRVVAISGVVTSIDGFVGADAKWTIPIACTWTSEREAAAPGLPGELRLLKRLAAREDPDMDPLLKRKHFSNALGLAIYRDNFEVIKWLVEEYLPCGRIRNELEYAAYSGQSRTIRWLWEHHQSRVVWTPLLVLYACGGGHTELAKWLHSKTGLVYQETKESIKSSAIWNGNLALLEWAIELGAHICTADFEDAAKSWCIQRTGWVAIAKNVRVSQSLAAPIVPGGQLEVVKWLAARQPGINLTVSARGLKYAPASLVSWLLENVEVEHKETLARGINAAASRNDLAFVKLAHENSNGESCTTAAMNEAAKAGHLEMVKWLHENRREGCTTMAMNDAASSGHLDVVEWLHENRDEGCTSRAMDGAAKYGHLETVKWLDAHRTEGCTTAAMDAAAGYGHLELIKWLHGNRREGCTTAAMDCAAGCGRLEMVKWLHSNRREGCTTRAMDAAAMNGHLGVVQWLHENRNEGCTTTAMDDAAKYGHLDVVQWLHENRSEGCTTAAMEEAANRGDFAVVRWLHEHRTEGRSGHALVSAKLSGNLDAVQWMVANGFAQVTWKAATDAIESDLLDVVRWMLPLLPPLPDNLDFRHMGPIRSLEMAQLLHADGRFPLGLKDYYWVLEHGNWQLLQWLMREYPDAMLTRSDAEAVMLGEEYGGVTREERAFLTNLQDAIFELELLRGG